MVSFASVEIDNTSACVIGVTNRFPRPKSRCTGKGEKKKRKGKKERGAFNLRLTLASMSECRETFSSFPIDEITFSIIGASHFWER